MAKKILRMMPITYYRCQFLDRFFTYYMYVKNLMSDQDTDDTILLYEDECLYNLDRVINRNLNSYWGIKHKKNL